MRRNIMMMMMMQEVWPSDFNTFNLHKTKERKLNDLFKSRSTQQNRMKRRSFHARWAEAREWERRRRKKNEIGSIIDCIDWMKMVLVSISSVMYVWENNISIQNVLYWWDILFDSFFFFFVQNFFDQLLNYYY